MKNVSDIIEKSNASFKKIFFNTHTEAKLNFFVQTFNFELNVNKQLTFCQKVNKQLTLHKKVEFLDHKQHFAPV